jgi:hypothetical protein
MRRVEIEDVLGELEMPEVPGGEYLLAILWKVGPVKSEAPLTEQDLWYWEERRGIKLEPWQADTIVEMSRAYLAEMYSARNWNAIPPWPPARNMWKYVRDQRNTASLRAAMDDQVKEQGPHGNRKRR